LEPLSDGLHKGITSVIPLEDEDKIARIHGFTNPVFLFQSLQRHLYDHSGQDP
jgi:hypothetical protein